MAPIQTDDVVSRSYRGPDRRRGGSLGKLQRGVVRLVHSRLIAMFAIAFAVSWSFHLVDQVSEHRIERNQRIIVCTLTGVARAQELDGNKNTRVEVSPILKACEQREGK